MKIDYKKMSVKTCFKDIEDKQCFYSGGVLYMRIFQQDLDHFNIKNVNAISIINGGLTFFDDDEEVNKSTKIVI